MNKAFKGLNLKRGGKNKTKKEEKLLGKKMMM